MLQDTPQFAASYIPRLPDTARSPQVARVTSSRSPETLPLQVSSTAHLGRPRLQLPPALVLLGVPKDAADRIRILVDTHVAVHAAGDTEAATKVLAGVAGTCLMVAVPGELQTGRAAEIERLHAAFPRVPTIGVFIPGESAHAFTLWLGKVGVTELLTLEGRFREDVLLSALSRCHAEGMAGRVLRDHGPRLPEAMIPLFRSAVRNAHQPLANEDLARAARMHERTLRKYCEQQHIPSPQWIIGWARLLVAGYYLDDPGRTLESVADMLGFPTAHALRNQFRRYTGVSPTTLRRQGAARAISRMIEQAAAECASAESPPHPPLLRLLG
jgi:AraC-like DNA-binding protein